MKNVFIKLDETSGECNWTNCLLQMIPEDKDPREYAEELAGEYYEDLDEEVSEGVYLFNGGCNMLKVLSVDVLTDEEYDVLRRFI